MALLLLAPAAAWAVGTPRAPETTVDPHVMQIDEARHLGATVPRDLLMTDALGRDFSLGELAGKPAILLMSYYDCDGTCPTMNRLLYSELPKVTRFRIGSDYRVLTVSFDARDTPQSAAEFLHKTGLPPGLAAGWRHAVLRDGSKDVDTLAASIGYRYFWSRPDKTFLHPNVLVFLTPEGRIARYLYGTNLDARAIELALTDADWGRIAGSASVLDMLAGVCFSYNYSEGRYQPNWSLITGAGSFAFGVLLIAAGALAYRRRRGRILNVESRNTT